jgi:hypothetical protein
MAIIKQVKLSKRAVSITFTTLVLGIEQAKAQSLHSCDELQASAISRIKSVITDNLLQDLRCISKNTKNYSELDLEYTSQMGDSTFRKISSGSLYQNPQITASQYPVSDADKLTETHQLKNTRSSGNEPEDQLEALDGYKLLRK